MGIKGLRWVALEMMKDGRVVSLPVAGCGGKWFRHSAFPEFSCPDLSHRHSFVSFPNPILLLVFAQDRIVIYQRHKLAGQRIWLANKARFLFRRLIAYCRLSL